MAFAGCSAAENVVSRAEFEELMQLVRSQKLASSLATLAALLAAAGPGDAAAGAEAARTCALGHLAILESHCGGLDNVHRILKVVVFVAGAPTPDMERRSPPMSTSAWFTESPAVADGYTDLMIAVLGDEAGAHARSAVCVASLPGGAAVEVEAIVEVRDPGLVKR